MSRPNRFIAEVLIDGILTKVHIKNTGRCRELLISNAKVYLEDYEGRMGKRKMRYSLIAVDKTLDDGSIRLINMDSQAPNKVVYEGLASSKVIVPGLRGNLSIIKPEQRFGDSRFDFYLETDKGDKAWMEVKGVTLENGGIASFPDAPTQRGVKHINELVSAFEMGYHAYILFVIQMKGVHLFKPNDLTHKAFGDALRAAHMAGVNVLAFDCIISENSMDIDSPVEIDLHE